jgi:hypothetical protein
MEGFDIAEGGSKSRDFGVTGQSISNPSNGSHQRRDGDGSAE